jgi:hypothetical protein
MMTKVVRDCKTLIHLISEREEALVVHLCNPGTVEAEAGGLRVL